MNRLSSPAKYWSVRTLLAWLVLACLLPGVIGATILFTHQYREGRSQQEKDTLQMTRALVQAVDHHLFRTQAVAQSLSTADSLRNGDFANFHRRARETIALSGLGTNAVLRDSTGKQILNTAVEYGQPLPQQALRENIKKIFSSGTTVISDLFFGLPLKRPLMSVDVPVIIDGKIVYALGVGILPEHFNRILKAQNFPPHWVGAIFDSTGTIVGRTHSAEQLIGTAATPALTRHMSASQEGASQLTTQEGVSVLAYHSRSLATNWRVAVGIAREVAREGLVRRLWMLAAGVTALFAIGLVLAWYMGGRIARSVKALAAPATALENGGTLPVASVHTKETADVAAAINRAAALLNDRVEKLQAKEKALRESESKFRSITDAMPQMVWSTRPDGYHDFYNQQWYRFTGMPEGSTDGEEWNGMFHPDDQDRAWETWKHSLETGAPYEIEYRLRHHSGQYRWTLGRALPVKDEQGNIIRWMGTCTDIHEQKLTQQELELADQRKDEFLAMLAHELRNPLAPIAAAADLLQFAPPTEERVRQTSEIISRQAKHMAGLIDDLMDVSRVTRGLAVLEKNVLDINQVVTDAVEQVKPLIDKRHHHLSVQTPADGPMVTGDQKRLVQVLTNLVSNAAKYTPEGGAIRIEVASRKENVVISVIDNGVGMSPELVQSAFELFTQAARTSDRSEGGLGIGLALVKSIVELHHGTVTAHSDGIGKGSTFTLCLPRRHVESTPSPKQCTNLPAEQNGIPLKIMVVDDNADAAFMLSTFLEMLGHAVLVEHNSNKALQSARLEKPDVCILDIGLPDMDGNELARRLHAQEETAQAILIAVTGYGQERDREDAFRAGFHHHFVKPVGTERLTGLLRDISRSLCKQ